jgi:hypothetical protein
MRHGGWGFLSKTPAWNVRLRGYRTALVADS